MLDGNARQNLATFCQTWEEPQVHALMELAIDKNMIDKDEYPQTAEIERRCVHMLADLWNAPESANTVGASAIGSSEACMLGGHGRQVALAGEARGRRASRPTGRTWCAGRCRWCGTSSPSTGTSRCARCRCRTGTTRWTPTTCSSGSTRTRSWSCRRFGVTYTGAYELVKPLADALDQLQADTGLDVDIHVDGASGGFLAPFCAPDLEWDFRLPRVKSISTSGHKFGLAPLGVGWVVWRDVAELPDDLIFHVNYLGGDMPVFQINFSRPAGQIVAQYYDFLRLGREGYRRVHMASLRHRADTSPRRSPTLGPFELLCDSDPQTGIPTVTWRIAEGADPGYTLFDLADRLRIRGWQVPAYTLTGTRLRHRRAAHPRAPGRQPRPGRVLLDDMRDAIAHFAQAPGHRADDQGGVERLQPPLTDAAARPLVGAEPRRVVGRRPVHGRLRLLRRRARCRRTPDLGRGGGRRHHLLRRLALLHLGGRSAPVSTARCRCRTDPRPRQWRRCAAPRRRVVGGRRAARRHRCFQPQHLRGAALVAERRPGRPPGLDAGRARLDRLPGRQRAGLRRRAAAVAARGARATSAGRSRP